MIEYNTLGEFVIKRWRVCGQLWGINQKLKEKCRHNVTGQYNLRI